MKTKKVYIIEQILCVVINVIFLPVSLISALFHFILQAFEFCLDKRDIFISFISHKLFLCCDEKDTIKNKIIYDNMSVRGLYKFLKEIKKYKENNENKMDEM